MPEMQEPEVVHRQDPQINSTKLNSEKISEDVLSKMQSLEDRIENKLQEIDKLFVVNPIEEKSRPLLNSGINQM